MIWVQDQMAHLLDRSDTDEPPGTSTVRGCFDDGADGGRRREYHDPCIGCRAAASSPA
jgi:hypothetical protein